MPAAAPTSPTSVRAPSPSTRRPPHGNAAPVATITGISAPRALALDPAGDLLVASANGSISVYAAGAHGAATPIATIGGQSNPSGLTFGSNGWLYVSEDATNRINEYNTLAYAPGAHGAPAPINTIFGPDTGLSSPQALVVDSAGQAERRQRRRHRHRLHVRRDPRRDSLADREHWPASPVWG